MEQTKKNHVFKYFIALCIIVSTFVIYFLIQRPEKLILEVIDQDVQMLEFTFNNSDKNPSFQKLIDRSHDGSHVILVLLTKNLRVMKNTNYEQLISLYNQCEGKLPCKVYEMDREAFLKLAKKRKY